MYPKLPLHFTALSPSSFLLLGYIIMLNLCLLAAQYFEQAENRTTICLILMKSSEDDPLRIERKNTTRLFGVLMRSFNNNYVTFEMKNAME